MSEETKFTEGEWYAYDTGRGTFKVTTKELQLFGGYQIATVNHYKGNMTLIEANANLIAAAPDLYAACLTALSALEMGFSNEDDYAATVAELQFALAKARGE